MKNNPGYLSGTTFIQPESILEESSFCLTFWVLKQCFSDSPETFTIQIVP